MKKIFEKSVLKCVVFVVLMLQLSCVACINAAQNDNLQLEIGAGKPAASPNIAVPNEETVLNFNIWVIDSVTRKEVTPLNIKHCIYKLECPIGTITKTEPTMTIAADKHSATLTSAILYADIKQTTKCLTKGKLKSTLNVKIVFNDNSSLTKSFSIEIDVVDATVTVYAKKPDKVVPRTNLKGKTIMCYVLNDPTNPLHDSVGHSFWSCQIDKLNTTYTDGQKNLSGKKYGLYPKNQLSISNILFDTPGKINSDDVHKYSASKTYSITVEKSKNLINKTIEKINLIALKYNLFGPTWGADNCTSLSVSMCNVEAGGASPDGKGEIGVLVDETTEPIFLNIEFPNPYHHVIQIESTY